MNKPLISICIPTFNRAPFLKECLDSITRQFSNQEIRQNVNVFILDNQSQDNTEHIVKKFTNIFKNIKYIKDNQNRNIAQGIIKIASMGDGEYVWVFSDDDLQTNNAIDLVIKAIKSNQPSVIICNINNFLGKQKNFNLLKINQNYFFTNRTDFFKYLNKNVFNLDKINLYATFCTNFILKKEIFNNYHYILNKFNGPLDLFPFHSIIFYSDVKITVEIISTPTLFNRRNNELWGYKNKIKHYFYTNKLLKYHYKNIINFNKNDFSFLFSLKLNINNIIRIKSLLKILLITLFKKIFI